MSSEQHGRTASPSNMRGRCGGVEVCLEAHVCPRQGKMHRFALFLPQYCGNLKRACCHGQFICQPGVASQLHARWSLPW